MNEYFEKYVKNDFPIFFLFNPTFYMFFANGLNMKYAQKWLPELIEQVPRYFHARMQRNKDQSLHILFRFR